MHKRPSFADRARRRVQAISARQDETKWGPDYQPAIQVVRGEAPTNSNVVEFYSAKLQRPMHMLSRPETGMAALALHNENVWEVHEQHRLHPRPAPHPLANHPDWRQWPWPASSGTVNLAASLGVWRSHPMYYDEEKEAYEPIPWIGDFLLFLKDSEGPYLVSWDCKTSPSQHGMPGPASFRARASNRAIAKATVREKVYQAYMAELQIPIRRVSRDDIDPDVRMNLLRLLKLHARGPDLPDSITCELANAFGEALKTGEPPVMVIRRLVREPDQWLHAKTLLDQLIWYRKLRVDLFRPIHIDRPLNPERSDVLDVYAHLFSR